MPILTNLTTLPSLLPLTTLTALLLTAEWSVDTPAARASLTLTESLTPCPSIQFLEFPVTPPFLHRSPTHRLTEHLQNLTTDPPYLPHLRVITRTDNAITTVPYNDAFDGPAIARFLASLCGLPFPPISSRDTVARSLRSGLKAAVVVDGHPFTPASKLVFDELSDRGGWVLGFAGAEDVVFRERHSARPPAVVFLDRARGCYETLSIRGVDALREAVERFEKGVTRDAGVGKRVLEYFREPLVWRLFAEHTTPRGLDAWMGDNHTEESFLWVFVTAPWCAFCQRSLPEFERFVRAVRGVARVHAVIVDDVGLPTFLDELVDGFPTVLLLRESGAWTGVQEYVGERSVRAMVDVHAGEVERDLRRALAEDAG